MNGKPTSIKILNGGFTMDQSDKAAVDWPEHLQLVKCIAYEEKE